MPIHFLSAGGTIDKVYFDAMSEFQVGPPQVAEILKLGNVSFAFTISSVLKKDSLDLRLLSRVITRTRNINFGEYLHLMVALRKASKLREFHLILGSLLHLRKSGAVVTELLNPDHGGDEVLMTSEQMRSILVEKYSNLFRSSEPIQSFCVGNIQPVSEEQVSDIILRSISKGKGLSMDCIPDILLSLMNPVIRGITPGLL